MLIYKVKGNSYMEIIVCAFAYTLMWDDNNNVLSNTGQELNIHPYNNVMTYCTIGYVDNGAYQHVYSL